MFQKEMLLLNNEIENVLSYKGSFIRAFFYFVFTFVLAMSCSKTPKLIDLKKVSALKKSDFIDHLESLGQEYLKANRKNIINLKKRERDYLEGIYKTITVNNELILKKNISPTFHVIKSDYPFYFSLPSGEIFFSDRLINKYVGSENLLLVVLSIEIYRIHQNLYEKNIFIPTGSVNTKKLISLTKIPWKARLESLKWASFILKRSGHDPFSVLSWLQTQNKAGLDFSVQLGNTQVRAREEFLFKNFLAKQTARKGPIVESNEANSSKEFYYFKRVLR